MKSQTIGSRDNADQFGRKTTQRQQGDPTTRREQRNTTPKGSSARLPNNGHPSSTSADGSHTGVAGLNSPQTSPGIHPESSSTPKDTIFRLDAPSAKRVFLAGEFTDWDKSPVKMIQGGGGVWHVKVPLAPGRHLYRFVVDGEWRDDPKSSTRVANPFGAYDSAVDVS